ETELFYGTENIDVKSDGCCGVFDTEVWEHFMSGHAVEYGGCPCLRLEQIGNPTIPAVDSRVSALLERSRDKRHVASVYGSSAPVGTGSEKCELAKFTSKMGLIRISCQLCNQGKRLGARFELSEGA